MRGLATDILGKAMRDGSRPLYRLALADSAAVNGVLLPREAAIDAIESVISPARIADDTTATAHRSKSRMEGRGDSTFLTAPARGKESDLPNALGTAGSAAESQAALLMRIGWSANGEGIREVSVAGNVKSEDQATALATIEAGSGSSGSVVYRQSSGPNLFATAVTSGTNKSFVHEPVFRDPYIGRLTRKVAKENLDCELVNGLSDAVLVNYQQYSNSTPQPGLFLLDESWQRIVYGEDGYYWAKSWGNSDPNPQKNLQIPVGLVADGGNFSAHDWKVNMYVAECGDPPRVLRLIYDFQSHGFTFSDSLSLTSDALGPVDDCDLDDNGTPGDPADDMLWVLDGTHDRLLQFSCFGPKGIQRTFDIPYGGGPGQVRAPRRIAMGRTLTGNSDEIFVMDGPGRVLRFLIGSSQLTYEDQYVVNGSTFGGNNGFEDIAVDAYNQLYIATTYPATIRKLSPQLQQLAIFDHPGFGPEDLDMPRVVCVPRPTAGISGYADLLIGEEWTDRTGGQAFAIGIDATWLGYNVRPTSPNTAQLIYTASDPHYLSLAAWRWDDVAKVWVFYTEQAYGLKYSGQSDDVYFGTPYEECPTLTSYKLRLITQSTYERGPGLPRYADTMEAVVNLGDRKLSVIEPLHIGSPCVYYYPRYYAKLKAAPAPCSGGLTYTWYSMYSGYWGDLVFFNGGVPCTTLTGPMDSVEFQITPLPAGGSAAGQSLAGGELPLPTIFVDFHDGGGHRLISDVSLHFCDCAECPWFSDPNQDCVTDVFDVIMLIDIVFRGWPPVSDPSCPVPRGDLYCDGFIDVMDIITMIDVVFSGAPILCDPCLIP
jgi:hypothetical protein